MAKPANHDPSAKMVPPDPAPDPAPDPVTEPDPDPESVYANPGCDPEPESEYVSPDSDPAAPCDPTPPPVAGVVVSLEDF